MSNYFGIKIITKDTESDSKVTSVIHSELPIDYTLKTNSSGMVTLMCHDKDYADVVEAELFVISPDTNEVNGTRAIVSDSKLV